MSAKTKKKKNPVRRHIILPCNGTRLFNQSTKDAIDCITQMGREGDNMVVIIKPGMTKAEMLQNIAQVVEYIEKDSARNLF